ncbi:glycoside hydrolase family 79 protein [Piloderma croceum F 1598]|uniref:Glycoside hydrolase family 79 protein n=1 Tax=Piloderma croceum (strain F 1598) TaxID=765440 RepID=A0A0C3EL28_PILCF|nr:glycoside hydrolase family 79 protein [Piloderma croceum F 1598]
MRAGYNQATDGSQQLTSGTACDPRISMAGPLAAVWGFLSYKQISSDCGSTHQPRALRMPDFESFQQLTQANMAFLVRTCFPNVLCTWYWPVLADQTPLTISFPAKAPPNATSNVVLDNFLGISFELSSFDTLWCQSKSTMPNAMQNYLANIRARIKTPLRVRVGGNSMDDSVYVTNQSNMITITNTNAYFNDIPVNFGPVFWEVLNSMSDRVGEMQFIIGLSMQDPSEDSNLIEIAATAEQQLGNRLDAMAMYEPDLYANHGTRANYTLFNYISEIGEVLHDLTYASAGNLLSKRIMAGPSICCDWDLDYILDAGLDQYYTIQHYPDNNCNGLNAQNTNISYFLSHTNVAPFTQWNQPGVNEAMQQGVPVLVTEYNSISCGGTNISDTVSPSPPSRCLAAICAQFAAAMWAVDVALNFASANISGAYIHIRKFNVSYNLFDPPTDSTSTESGWRTGSPYYSVLMLSETLSSKRSIVADLNIDNSIYSPTSTVAAYGIYDNGGKTQVKVLFNYANDHSQSFVIPTNTTFAVDIRMLIAPDVWETTNISWAGQTIAQNGDLEDDQTTQYIHCRDGCTIDVPGPGPGIALVLFDPKGPDTDSFFEGNSTIAGLSGYSSGETIMTAPPLGLWTQLSLSAICTGVLWAFAIH